MLEIFNRNILLILLLIPTLFITEVSIISSIETSTPIICVFPVIVTVAAFYYTIKTFMIDSDQNATNEALKSYVNSILMNLLLYICILLYGIFSLHISNIKLKTELLLQIYS
jgi:hypothetical protein